MGQVVNGTMHEPEADVLTNSDEEVPGEEVLRSTPSLVSITRGARVRSCRRCSTTPGAQSSFFVCVSHLMFHDMLGDRSAPESRCTVDLARLHRKIPSPLHFSKACAG